MQLNWRTLLVCLISLTGIKDGRNFVVSSIDRTILNQSHDARTHAQTSLSSGERRNKFRKISSLLICNYSELAMNIHDSAAALHGNKAVISAVRGAQEAESRLQDFQFVKI